MAGGLLNANQTAFAAELSAKTGLDPKVVAGWVLSEEPASSKQAPNGANNWLNIGATDSGYYGAGNPAWSDPKAAADFTAQWMAGTAAPGFGTASSGIQSILKTAGKSISDQIVAIQHSGWASSGYPNLVNTVESVSGSASGGITLQEIEQWLTGNYAGAAGSAIAGNTPSNPLKGIDQVGQALSDMAEILKEAASGKLWLRLLEVLAGVALLAMGLMSLSGRTTTPITVVQGAARTGKKAAMAAAA
jgi:hypothetical protein